MLRAFRKIFSAPPGGEAHALHGQERHHLGLERGEAGALLEEGRARAQGLASFYAPVSVIKREFSMERRIELVEHLWRVSFADGNLNLYEDHYVRKIAHLLYVPNVQSMLARNRAKQTHEAAPRA